MLCGALIRPLLTSVTVTIAPRDEPGAEELDFMPFGYTFSLDRGVHDRTAHCVL
jgi:hypothetical protein